MKLYKPGMRTIKTGIGVMLCVLLGYLNFNLVDKTFYAAIACVVCMQTTVKGSFTVGINRLKGTFIGGLVGFLFALIDPGNPILSCLGIITTIYICNLIKINKSITIACVVYCAIHLGIGTADPVYYSVHRIIDTSIGVLIGIGVNYLIYRPDYLGRIHNEIKIIENTSIKLLKKEIEMGVDIDISSLQNEITKLEGLYKNFLDELEYRNDEVDDKEINRIIKTCKQIYMHLQVLGHMKDKCYLNQENFIKSKDLYYELASDVEVKEDISPVYNYHISMIIEKINDIRDIDDKL
ncbi:aromatic acid exporter family protein [Romboutsia ilealis]|uniref:Aromatic acid exporter family protein n=1 Tax=Romboutsia faecis TaxID=2764597 RepID=A0ABR7JQH5_9FIRM|nr:aromatic acid exporter family protein [Romboutsia faecis]MBC5997171.1 aromatic acid exporter family protein [Romboutsia faecis]MRN23453.1 aromatic acid exporter family protein [Romboutsia ilealis]